MSIEDYLIEKGIDYRTSGKNVTKGWIEVNCPWCDDPSFHLGISPDGWLNCWRCGSHGRIENFIAEIENCSLREAKLILSRYSLEEEEVEEEVDESKDLKEVALPREAKLPLSNLHKRFLIRRGFDPDYLVGRYGIKGTGSAGKYKFRIIIPIYFKKKLVSFVTRDVTGKQIRYKNCKGVEIKRFLYNYDRVKKGKTLTVVEGIFDVWRLEGNTVATFGTNFTKEQVRLILEKQPKKVSIVYDGEEEAIEKAYELASYLSPFTEVKVIELDEGKDPASLSTKEVWKLKTITGG